MSQKIIHRISGLVETIGAVTEVVCLTPIPADSTFSAEATVTGRDTVSGDSVISKRTAGGKNLAGVAVITGAVLDAVAQQNDAALATASVTLAINGTNLELRATGVLAKTIEWFGELIIHIN